MDDDKCFISHDVQYFEYILTLLKMFYCELWLKSSVIKIKSFVSFHCFEELEEQDQVVMSLGYSSFILVQLVQGSRYPWLL